MSSLPAPSGRAALPQSVTHFGLNLIALVTVVATFVFLRKHDLGVQDNSLALCVAVGVPIILIDLFILKVYRRASTGLDWNRKFEFDLGRIATKYVGLGFTVGLIALAYWVFPEYHGSFYDPLYSLLQRFWIPLVVTAVFYIALVDGQLTKPHDAYWQLGRFVFGRWRDARKGDVANHFRGWLVKAYFLPLMLVWMTNDVRQLIHFDLSNATWSNLRLYDFIYSFLFLLDLLFSTVGYVMSLRAIDTHIRTAEPTMYGWVVALFCYQPFYSLMERQYVHYGDNGFGGWLAAYPTIRSLWTAVILALVAIYMLGTVTFGIRFSNLTHRGILTNGPYRFTKHPAYISKNLSWWLVSVPFLVPRGQDWTESLRSCFALGCVNMIYFLRARTEEAHLSRDPVYVEYALWMNEHGLLSFLGRWFPILRYKAPAGSPLAERPAAAHS
ncbi:MAG: isoprenylcysteine carboxylmethyltransferase family protein [Polyangiaceae bacterium]|jgi:protein-S-isoprenylcysteine O-methyltransferase Ste14